MTYKKKKIYWSTAPKEPKVEKIEEYRYKPLPFNNLHNDITDDQIRWYRHLKQELGMEEANLFITEYWKTNDKIPKEWQRVDYDVEKLSNT